MDLATVLDGEIIHFIQRVELALKISDITSISYGVILPKGWRNYSFKDNVNKMQSGTEE